MDDMFFTLFGRALFGIAFVVPLWYFATWLIIQVNRGIHDWLYTLPKEQREARRMQELKELLTYHKASIESSPKYATIREAFPGWRSSA